MILKSVVVLIYTDFDTISCAGSSDTVANEVENNQRILLRVITFYFFIVLQCQYNSCQWHISDIFLFFLHSWMATIHILII